MTELGRSWIQGIASQSGEVRAFLCYPATERLDSSRQSVEQSVFNPLRVRGMTLHRPHASSSFPRSLSCAKADERESISTGVTWTDACAPVTTRCRREASADRVRHLNFRKAVFIGVVLCLAGAYFAVRPNSASASQAACTQNSKWASLVQKGNNTQLPVEVRARAYEDAAKLCPSSPVIDNNIAILLLQQQQYANALVWIRRGLGISAHDPDLSLDLGVVYLSAGKPEQALPVLKSIAATPRGEFYLGMAYRALRDHQAARQAFAKSFSLGNNDPYDLYALIEQDKALHDEKQGLKDFQAFEQRFPRSAWLHLLLGNAYNAQDDSTRAEGEYGEAVRLDPNIPLARFQRGRIEFSRADYSRAFQDFKDEIAVDPAFGEAYLYAGTSLRRLGKNSEAIPYLEKAVARDPNFALSYRELATGQIQAKQLQAAMRTLEEGEKRFPSEAAFPAQLARLLKKTGDTPGAETQATLAETLSRQSDTELGGVPVSKGPPARSAAESVVIQRLRACIDRADAVCTKAALAQAKTVRLEDSADDLNLEAAALNLLHQDQPALAAIQRAIQMNGHQASYLVTEGRIYQRMGNQAAAIKCFLNAEQMQRGAAAPLYYLGMSFFMLGNYYNDNQDYNRAARHFQTALELDPRYDRAEFMLGIVNAIEFKLDDAEKELAKALQMNPDNAYYHLHYGMVLARRGHLAGGQREIRLAEKLNPSYAPSYLHLGDLDAQMGNYPEAREQLESAIRLDPHLAPAYYTLGTVYHHLGLVAESRDAFQKFQQMKSQQDQNTDPVESSISLAESRSAAKRQ